MNLTQIIKTICDEKSAAIDNLSKRGISAASVETEIEMHARGMPRAAEYTRPVNVTGLKNRAINSGVLKRWTPSFGQENAEIKLDSQALHH
jgi:hypothetical protein